MIDPITGLDVDPEDSEHLTVTTSNYPEFESAVRARVLFHLADLGLDEEYLTNFSIQLSLRIDSLLQKYRAGQLEHGGDLRDRDLTREETNEISDLFIYNLVRTTLQGLKAEIKIS